MWQQNIETQYQKSKLHMIASFSNKLMLQFLFMTNVDMMRKNTLFNINIHIHIRISVYIYKYVYMYMCIYICIYILYMYMYIYNMYIHMQYVHLSFNLLLAEAALRWIIRKMKMRMKVVGQWRSQSQK